MTKAPSRGRRIFREHISSEIVVGPTIGSKSRPDEADLFADPMPARVEPCLARAAAVPPEGENWSYEVKWDGYRLAIHVGPEGAVRILTKGGFDWTNRFPSIAAAAGKLAVDSCILDGEAVVLDEQGRSDFQALQAAVPRQGRDGAPAIHFYAFDLLYLDGVDYRGKPLAERRHALATVVPAGSSQILFSEEVVADGHVFFRLACEMGLEGIIAKKQSAPYRSGRGGEWLKIKCVQSESFVIIGYRASRRSVGGLGRILLAAKRSGKLVYVGSVGTGFAQTAAESLLAHLRTIEAQSPATPTIDKRSARWVSPQLTAEIEFRGWTTDRKLRHGSFKGLRGDDGPAAIFELPE